MNAFKISYKVSRKNSDEIYRGFGFRHLSDATQYYVHPNNQSYKGTTTLCQPIGESIILFSMLMKSVIEGNPIGDFSYRPNHCFTYLIIRVPQEYRDNRVVEDDIYTYHALGVREKIIISAYDENDNLIYGNMDHLRPLYKLLPFFMVLLARDYFEDEDFRILMDGFVDNPVADTFVNIHEDFYQKHKTDDFDIDYDDLLKRNIGMGGMNSFVGMFEAIRDNMEARVCKEVEITPFNDDAFTEEQKRFIPRLTSEFVLPDELRSICNAIVNKDMLSVLLHGPAGTGKTMSLKLIAQAIKLPIMQTVNCTENLDEFVLGKYIPQDDKIIFKESLVTEAIRSGGAVIFEEINFAKPQHLAFLNSLLDDNGFVRLDNGEIIYRHHNFRFFATMNLGYFGTKELNQALYNRFNGIVEISQLSDEAIKRMLTIRVPECRDVADKLISVYHKLKSRIESEELDVVISPRNLENWARLAKYEGYIRSAEKTIIPIARCDRALEDVIRGIIMLYKWS